MSGKNQWNRYGNLKQQLLENQLQRYKSPQIHRSYGMLVGRILRGALKIRYLLLGGAVGGTVTLNNVRLFSSLIISISSNVVLTDASRSYILKNICTNELLVL